VQRNGRSVLEFVRSQGNVARGFDRVKGMNLDKVGAPQSPPRDMDTNAPAGPPAQDPNVMELSPDNSPRPDVSAAGRQLAPNAGDGEAEKLHGTPPSLTLATTISSQLVSVGGRQRVSPASPTPMDTSGFPITPGKNFTGSESTKDSDSTSMSDSPPHE